MKNLVIDAHRKVETPTSLGWDITYTENGLMIIEANTGWGVEDFQFGRRNALLDEQFVNLVKEDLGINEVNCWEC